MILKFKKIKKDFDKNLYLKIKKIKKNFQKYIGSKLSRWILLYFYAWIYFFTKKLRNKINKTINKQNQTTILE